MIKIEVSWGHGTDILLISDAALSLVPLDNKGWSGGAGSSNHLHIDLSLDEAIKLKRDLSSAIQEVKELNNICETHDSKAGYTK